MTVDISPRGRKRYTPHVTEHLPRLSACVRLAQELDINWVGLDKIIKCNYLVLNKFIKYKKIFVYTVP